MLERNASSSTAELSSRSGVPLNEPNRSTSRRGLFRARAFTARLMEAERGSSLFPPEYSEPELSRSNSLWSSSSSSSACWSAALRWVTVVLKNVRTQGPRTRTSEIPTSTFCSSPKSRDSTRVCRNFWRTTSIG